MTLKDQNLLSAQRAVYVLADKPGTPEVVSKQCWCLKLKGLHQAHLKSAVAHLRKQELEGAKAMSQECTLELTSLQHSLAQALGAQSYDHWLTHEQSELFRFLAQHGLKQPADLISWADAPMFFDKLTARQISDRIFNSGLSLPRRIFTGVGSHLFARSRYERIDIKKVADGRFSTDGERYEFCMKHADSVLLGVQDNNCGGGPTSTDLTRRALMLNAASEYVGFMFNLLGSNLVDPISGDSVVSSYNKTDKNRAFELQIFALFREEIEQSEAGWVEVLAVPGNQNLVFLKGPGGAFDWVVRDQRDGPLPSDPLIKFFDKDEIPVAMDTSPLTAFLYFNRGSWQEKIEHDAESYHHATGGTADNWPGYNKLIERSFLARFRAFQPSLTSSLASVLFVSHQLEGYKLMVSPLITIDQFKSFDEDTDWRISRLEKAHKAGLETERDLNSVNYEDKGNLPVCVTWFDAVAYCHHYQQLHGLPVRLIEVEEWVQIATPSTTGKGLAGYSMNGELGSAVVGGDRKLGGKSSHCLTPDGVMSFAPHLRWTSNSEGLPFLSMLGFWEWLYGYEAGLAPIANFALGAVVSESMMYSRESAHLAMRQKGSKVGFRLCFVANPAAATSLGEAIK